MHILWLKIIFKSGHDLYGNMLVLVSSNIDLHILIVSPKHASPILFLPKKMPKGEIVGDISYHNLRQK